MLPSILLSQPLFFTINCQVNCHNPYRRYLSVSLDKARSGLRLTIPQMGSRGVCSRLMLRVSHHQPDLAHLDEEPTDSLQWKRGSLLRLI